MIDIKIVKLKDTDEYLNEDFNYVAKEDESKIYSIKDYRLLVTTNKAERDLFKKYSWKEKLEFLEIVRRNLELEKQIKIFREKFKIKENLPYANYYYEPQDKDITITPNIEISEEEHKFIEKIKKEYYIHEALESILVNLLYTGKILLSEINLNNKIRIEVNYTNEVNIVLCSNNISQNFLKGYIEKNWNKKIKPLIKKIKVAKEKLMINDKHKKIYDLHNSEGLSYGKILNSYSEYSGKESIKSICSDIKNNKIEPIFEPKEKHKERQNKN